MSRHILGAGQPLIAARCCCHMIKGRLLRRPLMPGYAVLSAEPNSPLPPFNKGDREGDFESNFPERRIWHYAPSVGNELWERVSAPMIAARCGSHKRYRVKKELSDNIAQGKVESKKNSGAAFSGRPAVLLPFVEIICATCRVGCWWIRIFPPPPRFP